MTWIVCSMFIGGILVGLVFSVLLNVAKEPETRPPLPDEAETGPLQRPPAPVHLRRENRTAPERAEGLSEGLRHLEI